MTVSRRTVLRGGGAAIVASTAGCRRLERSLFAWREPPRPTGPFAAPSTPTVDILRHVLERTGFGLRPESWGEALTRSPDAEEAAALYLEAQLRPETLDDAHADWAVRRLETLDDPPGELFELQPRLLLDEMVAGALVRATTSRRQLFEAMVGFWNDHFNVATGKEDCRWLRAALDRDVLRRHALGRFPDLLRAVTLSPAMLWSLDGRVNRAAAPNENHARELLELHTLGVDGGYTQRDVMEVARALTGWTVRSEERFGKGRVEFRREEHDDRPKEVLGSTIPAGLGAGDVDRVLDVVARHPSTARHLARKLCRRFVADDPSAEMASAVARTFASTDGDLRSTLRTLFFHPAFLAERGTKLKRPFHFVVSALRATDARVERTDALHRALLAMGHAPFGHPTPDGHPLEPSPWRRTLLPRFRLAADLEAGRSEGVEVDGEALRQAFGGTDAVLAHLFGRRPTTRERHAARHSGAPLALALASPAFQRF